MEKQNIFVSYRHTDLNGDKRGTDIARSIKLHLENMGYKGRVFFDYSEIHTGEFEKVILNVIKHCRIFILVLTRDTMFRCSNEGDWVRREIIEAQKQNCEIIPIEVDDLFNGYPEDMDEELDIIRRIQHSKVHMDSSFEGDMNNIIEKRIKPILPIKKSINWKRLFIVISFFIIFITLGIIRICFDNSENNTKTNEIAISNVAPIEANSTFKIVTHDPTPMELREIDKALYNLAKTTSFNKNLSPVLLQKAHRTDDTITFEYRIETIDITSTTDRSTVLNKLNINSEYCVSQFISHFIGSMIIASDYNDQNTYFIHAIHLGMNIEFIFNDCNDAVIAKFTYENKEVIEAIEKYCTNVTQEPTDRHIEEIENSFEAIRSYLPYEINTNGGPLWTDIKLSPSHKDIILTFKLDVDFTELDNEQRAKYIDLVEEMIPRDNVFTEEFMRAYRSAMTVGRTNLHVQSYISLRAIEMGLGLKYIYYDRNDIYICHHNFDILNIVKAIKESYIEDLHKFQQKQLI